MLKNKALIISGDDLSLIPTALARTRAHYFPGAKTGDFLWHPLTIRTQPSAALAAANTSTNRGSTPIVPDRTGSLAGVSRAAGPRPDSDGGT